MIEQDFYSGPAVVESGDEALPADRGETRGPSAVQTLTLLVEHKWLIAKVTASVTLVGLILCFVLPVRYTAVTSIMPPQQTQSSASLIMGQMMGGGAGSLAAMAGAGLGLKNPNDTYTGLLKSRTMADAMIKRFGLVGVYQAKSMNAARKELEKNTDVTSAKSGFLEISVTDRDKKRAAEMANAYTEQLRLLTKSVAVTEASQRRLFYEDQLNQAKESLVEAEVSLQKIMQKSGMIALDAQAAVMIESIAALRAQVAAKQVELQALRSYSTNRNPEVQLAENELSSLQREVVRLEQRDHTAGSAHFGLQDVPGAGLDYLRAEREVKYRQALFEIMMKQYEVAKLDETKDAAIIQVVDPGIEPERKSSPKRAQITLFFAFAGFFGGCLLAHILWSKEQGQYDPDRLLELQALKSALLGRSGKSIGAKGN